MHNRNDVYFLLMDYFTLLRFLKCHLFVILLIYKIFFLTISALYTIKFPLFARVTTLRQGPSPIIRETALFL